MSERRGNAENYVTVSIGAPIDEPGLRKQSPWSKDPWKPGEIPASPHMRVLRPFDWKPRSQWSRDQNIECSPIEGRGMGPKKLARGGGGDDSTGYDEAGYTKYRTKK